RLEHRLQPGILALARQTVHLQETLVGLLLDLDQVRDRNGRLDFRKVDALAINILRKAVHSLTSKRKRERGPRVHSHAQASRGDGPMPLAYLTSTLAPTSSNFFLMALASSLGIPSLTALG